MKYIFQSEVKLKWITCIYDNCRLSKTIKFLRTLKLGTLNKQCIEHEENARENGWHKKETLENRELGR